MPNVVFTLESSDGARGVFKGRILTSYENKVVCDEVIITTGHETFVPLNAGEYYYKFLINHAASGATFTLKAEVEGAPISVVPEEFEKKQVRYRRAKFTVE